jgi:hypothetical protein
MEDYSEFQWMQKNYRNKLITKEDFDSICKRSFIAVAENVVVNDKLTNAQFKCYTAYFRSKDRKIYSDFNFYLLKEQL